MIQINTKVRTWGKLTSNHSIVILQTVQGIKIQSESNSDQMVQGCQRYFTADKNKCIHTEIQNLLRRAMLQVQANYPSHLCKSKEKWITWNDLQPENSLKKKRFLKLNKKQKHYLFPLKTTKLLVCSFDAIDHSHKQGRSLVQALPHADWDISGCRSAAASARSFHSMNTNFFI